VLIAVAPFALACHALPQTEGIARWWWRAFTAILAIQSAQAVVPPPRWLAPAVAAQARPLPAPLRLPATAISPAGIISLSGA
jgi:hypothetical protein